MFDLPLIRPGTKDIGTDPWKTRRIDDRTNCTSNEDTNRLEEEATPEKRGGFDKRLKVIVAPLVGAYR